MNTALHTAAKAAPKNTRGRNGAIAFAALAAAVVALVVLLPMQGYTVHILVQTATFGIAVFGLTIVLGLCGQINLAQAAFFGFGAYAVGLGTTDLHLNFWVALAMGAAIALVMGGFLGMTTLKLGGHYLAMVTISFQQIVTLIMVNWIPVTHGPDGVGKITRPELFQSSQAFLGLCVAAMALIGYLVWRLPQTPLGRAMRAVRDNELAAGVAGVDVYRVKVAAFALSAVLGGIGGGLFAGGFAYVSPDQFSFAESIVLITMTLLGGVASPVGALIGTGLLIVLPESLRFLKSVPGLYLAIYGLSIVLIIRYMPDGIWGFVQDRVRRYYCNRPDHADVDCAGLNEGPLSEDPSKIEKIWADSRRSFPSGHASTSFALATYAALVTGGHFVWGKEATDTTRAWGIPLQAAVLSLAAFVAWSRVNDGRHNLSDVLTGAALGTAMANLAYWRRFDTAGHSRNSDFAGTAMSLTGGPAGATGVGLLVRF